MGNVLSGGTGQSPAKQASLLAGLSSSTEAVTVNKVCASGLKAVVLASQNIRLGLAEAQVAGGMEKMSRVPYYAPRGGGMYLVHTHSSRAMCRRHGRKVSNHPGRIGRLPWPILRTRPSCLENREVFGLVHGSDGQWAPRPQVCQCRRGLPRCQPRETAESETSFCSHSFCSQHRWDLIDDKRWRERTFPG